MSNIMKILKEKGKVVLIPGLVLATLLFIYIFNGWQKQATALVKTGAGTYLEASGMVENDGVDLSSEVTGTLLTVEVKEGETVKAGQILAKLDDTVLQHKYDQALASLEIAKKNVETLENSVASFAQAAENTAEQAKSAYHAAQGEFEKVSEGARPEEVAQVEETARQTEQNLIFMQTNLERSKELFAQGAIAQSQLDEVANKYEVALAQHNSAQAQLALVQSGPTVATIKVVENKMLQAKAGYELAVSNGNMQLEQLESQLEIGKLQLTQAEQLARQAESDLAKAQITSPMSGIVNLIAGKPGEYIPMGRQVFQMYDPTGLEIKAYISEANIGHVKPGQDVDILVDSHENKVFKGRVQRINDQAEFTPKNIQTKEERVNTVFGVTIEVLDPEGVIKPGMPADVKIKVD